MAGPTRFSSLVAAPAMAVLSEIDGCALCYPAFPQLVLIRERHRDGVNHAETRALSWALSSCGTAAILGLEQYALPLDGTQCAVRGE